MKKLLGSAAPTALFLFLISPLVACSGSAGAGATPISTNGGVPLTSQNGQLSFPQINGTNATASYALVSPPPSGTTVGLQSQIGASGLPTPLGSGASILVAFTMQVSQQVQLTSFPAWSITLAPTTALSPPYTIEVFDAGTYMASYATNSTGHTITSSNFGAPTTIQPGHAYVFEVVQNGALTQTPGNSPTAASRHPMLPDPVDLVKDSSGRLRAFDATGDPLTIEPVTPSIPASALTNVPPPVIPAAGPLPTPLPFPTATPRPLPSITLPPGCHSVHCINPLATVTQNDSGGQSGYTFPGGAQGGVGDIYVAQQVVSGANLYPSPPGSKFAGESIFAPTTHGPNGNCWEVVTDTYNGYNQPAGVTASQVLFYNFCDRQKGQYGGYEGGMPIDKNFMNSYVATFSNGNGYPEYVVETELGADNAWHVLLYNVGANPPRWDDVQPDSAVGANASYNGGQGWSMFETHLDYGLCPPFPPTGMSGLRIHMSHTPHQDWQYATAFTPFGYGDCFTPDGENGTFYYALNFYSGDYAWNSQTFND